MNNTRYKILNKTKEGLVVKIGVMTLKLTWDAFNKSFEMDRQNKNRFYAKKEQQERMEKADELINELLICSFTKTEEPMKKISVAGAVADIAHKLQELLGCAALDVVNLVRKRREKLPGIYMRAKAPKKHTRPAEKAEPVKENLPATAYGKVTIGDAIGYYEDQGYEGENTDG